MQPLLLLSALLTCGPTPAPLHTSIVVSGIQPGRGTVVLRLYDRPDRLFETVYLAQAQPARQSTLTFHLELPTGSYAVAVFQDLNGDGELNAGLFHIPTEPVGFGNNFRPRFSAPAFADCAVTVAAPAAVFTIRLH